MQALTFASHYGIDLWCNGNTPVFGSGFLGSSPGRSTEFFREASCSNVRGFFVDLNYQVSLITHLISIILSVSTQPFADNAKVIQKTIHQMF